MSLVESGFAQMLTLIGLVSGMLVPTGVPPAAEDPVMYRVAPEQCLFYITWAGTAPANPQSQNHTERLLAEEEVQQTTRQLNELVRGIVRRAGQAGNAELATAVDDAWELGRLCMSHPAAVYITSAKQTSHGMDFQGGAIVNLGDEAGKVRSLLEQHQKFFFGENVVQVKQGDITWNRVDRGQAGPSVTWGFDRNYLVLGIGEGSTEAVVQRMQANPPQWLIGARDRLPVERRAALAYVNMNAVQEVIGSFMGQAEARRFANELGIGNVRSMVFVTGLNASGYLTRSIIDFDGPPQGLFALGSKPLTQADLAPIPENVQMAIVGRADPAKLTDTVINAFGAFNPAAHSRLRQRIREFETRTDIDLREDLVAALGDTWYLYDLGPVERDEAPQGGLARLFPQAAAELFAQRPFSGFVVLVPVRDAKKLARVRTQLIEAAKERRGDELESVLGPLFQVKASQWNGHEVMNLRLGDSNSPGITWSITDRFLVISPGEESVRTHLARAADAPSLAKIPQVAAILRQQARPVMITYEDTPEVFRRTYPQIQSTVQLVGGLLGVLGAESHVPTLPKAETIGRHLQPSFSVVQWTDAGLESAGVQTMPGINLGLAGPAAIGGLFHGSKVTRAYVRQDNSMENLRRLSKALLNYDKTHNRFPPRAIADAQSRPLLSWRVAILPLLGHEELYKQFRLNESWDSPHNRQLLGRMPDVFQSPLNKAGPGTTTYLGVTGDNTVFSAAQPIGSMQTKDDPDETIMLVEVPDSAAVEWTRPQDFQADLERPMDALTGPGRKGFLAALADGSVRFVDEDTRPNSLAAMFTVGSGQIREAARVPLIGVRPAADSGQR